MGLVVRRSGEKLRVPALHLLGDDRVRRARSLQHVTSACLSLVCNAIGSFTGPNLRTSNCFRSVNKRESLARPNVRTSFAELSVRHRRLPDLGQSGGTPTAASLVMRVAQIRETLLCCCSRHSVVVASRVRVHLGTMTVHAFTLLVGRRRS